MASRPPSNAFLIINDQVHRLKGKLTTIGRSFGNHIVIADPLVSRKHAEIHYENNQFVLHDLNSTGGTLLNGVQVTQTSLSSGDSIILAGVAIVFAKNLPQVSKQTTAETDRIDNLGPDNEPTMHAKELDWRRKI